MMRAIIKSTSLAISFLVFSIATLQAEGSFSVVVNGAPCTVNSIIERDITVIGGGSSGTYSAIRLSDLGKTVALIEQNNRLGGHTETYHDPQSGKTIDIGVIYFHNKTVVKKYFERLNVSLGPADAFVGTIKKYVDFRTGAEVANYSAPDPSAAISRYLAQVLQYPFLEKGFELPYPVPADLLLPFGKFIEKYELQDMAGFIFRFAQGLGNLMAQPTIYVFKNIGISTLQSYATGFLASTLRDNSLLYEHATEELGPNVFMNTKVVFVERAIAGGVKVLIKTPAGLVLIKSQKLVVAIPPRLNNLAGWDLSKSEKSLFAQFGNSAYYTGLLRNTGIPDGISVTNVGDDTLYNLPVLPGVYNLGQSNAPGLMSVQFGSQTELSDTEARQAVISSVKSLEFAGKVPSEPELAVFASHIPFELTVPASAIASGFYKDLYALQGRRSTYYVGAAFHTHDSSLLWEFSESLLPKVIRV